jgi:hypothetical protein
LLPLLLNTLCSVDLYRSLVQRAVMSPRLTTNVPEEGVDTVVAMGGQQAQCSNTARGQSTVCDKGCKEARGGGQGSQCMPI